MSVSNCKINYIKDIDLNKIKPSRSGAIIYTVYKNRLYFILGEDTPTGEITDFAGGVSFKKENFLDGGLRELTEESLGIFGEISADEIKNFLAVYDENTIILFIRLDIDIIAKHKEFKERVKCVINPEVKDLKILDKQNFIALCRGDKICNTVMYDRVRTLLSTAKDQHQFLKYL